ncbi:protein ECT2 isoform X2 [Folsomia candida]|uniref:protein ECT2 isoform X2 n=1 Tax=Folsomia candida TaxID=158441 RepID=UPI001604C501|nr:protein ECT2 isoform X2 [Folsomia candida]
MEPGYWTDATSVDGLSTCSDLDDLTSVTNSKGTNPLTPSTTSSTPVNPKCVYAYPTTAYWFGKRPGSDLCKALKTLGVEFVVVENEEDEANSITSKIDPTSAILIFQDFCGPLFESLRTKRSPRLRIYGPPIILELANIAAASASLEGAGKPIFPLSQTGYPLYSRLLRNCKICATGIRAMDDLINIRRRVFYLDGIFSERECPMTHLVAGRCRGIKYRDAVALDKPILRREWIDFLWENRDSSDFDIRKDKGGTLERFKVRAFYGARIALDGFEPGENAGMVKLIEENEGVYVNSNDPTTTHIVINDMSETDVSEQREWADRAKVLKAEWFWTSIQIEACADENLYLLNREFNSDDTLNNSVGTPNSFTSPALHFSDTDGGGTPVSQSSSVPRRKRKRLMREFVSSLAQVESPHCIMELDEETVDLDNLVKSPEQSNDNVDDTELAVILKRIEKGLQSPELKTKMESFTGKGLKRLNEFAHLVETEKNYVTILMHIIKLFKGPCEANDQKAGRILTPLEIKHIFGPILPIYELHKRILRDMLHILENYSDDSLIGQIYVKNAEELRKCYEPFVGYFETVKNEIIRCETENPRFMAFLRIAQAKPQCGKEKLVELIIRPVQRLPSTALVLKNLEKNTEKTNPDYEWITKGVEAIDRVNQKINQQKERADSRVAIFDVYHDIEGCPVELISDHRTLLKKYDVIALHYDANVTVTANYKNELLSLIVFSDHFQVVKRRNHLASAKNHPGSTLSISNLRSPAMSRKSMKFTSSSTGQKRYKFLEWVSFCHVKKVVNVHDSDPRSFAFIVREPEDLRERVLQFNLPEDLELEKYHKMSVVEFFAKQVAQSVQRVDYEHFITTVDSAALNNTGNSSGGFISRGIKKVGRALSLSRTPSKLKRTMSQIMHSPFSTRSCHKDKDPDSVSQSGSENSAFTPIRNHLSSISLFGTKRGTMTNDGQITPKTRKTIFDSKDSKRIFPAIEET